MNVYKHYAAPTVTASPPPHPPPIKENNVRPFRDATRRRTTRVTHILHYEQQ